MRRRIVKTLTAKIVGTIYNQAYTDRDLRHIVDLFNEIHSAGMTISLEDVRIKDYDVQDIGERKLILNPRKKE